MMPSNDKREALEEALRAVEHLGNSYMAGNIQREIAELDKQELAKSKKSD
ncbi:MAG: hypothetical protein GY893_06665 [bacterium]|nr:hypothetical protein [bacterium]